MLSGQEEQAERLDVLKNDARVRGSTFSQFAESDADTDRGRFTSHERSTVIGSSPTPASQYPAGPAWSAVELPPEPSLSASVNDMQPTGERHEVCASIPSTLGQTAP